MSKLIICYPYEKIFAVHNYANTSPADFFNQLDEIQHLNGINPFEVASLNKVNISDIMTTFIDNGTSDCPNNCDIYYDIWLIFPHGKQYKFDLCAENFDILETLISQG